MWPLEIIAAMLAVGSLAGFIAGLLGVGGGTIIVPVVLWALQLQGIGNHPYAQHLAVGTSFAVMLFTTLSSVAAQHKKQSIDTGVLFGAVSSWVGIGGGSLSVPFLIYCNMPPHKAVGTSSGLAWPIALAGTVGYLAAGRHISGLPDGAVGFLYLPAVAILSIATIVVAPLGVKTAHKLPPETLKTAFGLLLLAIAARMLWKMV